MSENYEDLSIQEKIALRRNELNNNKNTETLDEDVRMQIKEVVEKEAKEEVATIDLSAEQEKDLNESANDEDVEKSQPDQPDESELHDNSQGEYHPKIQEPETSKPTRLQEDNEKITDNENTINNKDTAKNEVANEDNTENPDAAQQFLEEEYDDISDSIANLQDQDNSPSEFFTHNNEENKQVSVNQATEDSSDIDNQPPTENQKKIRRDSNFSNNKYVKQAKNKFEKIPEKIQKTKNLSNEEKLEKLIVLSKSTGFRIGFIGFTAMILMSYTIGLFVSTFRDNNVTLNPITLIGATFSLHNFGSIFMLMIFAVLILSAFLLIMQKKNDYFSKERNFSEGGELGTATMMPEYEQKIFLEKTNKFEDISSFIYGKDINTGEFVGRREPSRLNKNFAIFGAQGTSKSEGCARNNIEINSRRGVSMIITDPKGELYQDTAKLLESRGYTVKVWNLINTLSSDSWNVLGSVRKDNLNQLIEAIMANTEDDKNNGDAFFEKIEKMILRALCLYVMEFDNVDDSERTLGRVNQLLVTKTPEQLDALFATIPDTSEASSSWHLFKSSPSNRANALLGLGSRLQDLQDPIISELVSRDDIDLELPGKEKCAYFIIRKAQDQTYVFLSSLMLTFLFIKLSSVAERKITKKLDVEVMFILDEFVHMGYIPNYKSILGTVRSYNMGIMMFFQNLPQILDTFGEKMAVEILGGCHTTILLGCTDLDTARYFSQLSGVATVKTESIRKNLATIRMTNYTNDFAQSESVTTSNVMHPDEIQNLNVTNKALLFVFGSRPYKMDKSYAGEDNPTLAHKNRPALQMHDLDHVPKWIKEKLNETRWEKENIDERGGIYTLFDKRLSNLSPEYKEKLKKWREEALKNLQEEEIKQETTKETTKETTSKGTSQVNNGASTETSLADSLNDFTPDQKNQILDFMKKLKEGPDGEPGEKKLQEGPKNNSRLQDGNNNEKTKPNNKPANDEDSKKSQPDQPDNLNKSKNFMELAKEDKAKRQQEEEKKRKEREEQKRIEQENLRKKEIENDCLLGSSTSDLQDKEAEANNNNCKNKELNFNVRTSNPRRR